MLLLHRHAGETWRDAALRQGRKYGLEAEVKEHFDAAMTSGCKRPDIAAWEACYEWDVLDYKARN